MKKLLFIVLAGLFILGGCTTAKYTTKDGTKIEWTNFLTSKKLEDLHLDKTGENVSFDLGKSEGETSQQVDSLFQTMSEAFRIYAVTHGVPTVPTEP